MGLKKPLFEIMVFTVEDRTKFKCKQKPLCVWGKGDTFSILSLNGFLKMESLQDFREFSVLLETYYKGIKKGYYGQVTYSDVFWIKNNGATCEIKYYQNKIVIPTEFLEDFMFICRRFSRNWWSYYLDSKGVSEVYI